MRHGSGMDCAERAGMFVTERAQGQAESRERPGVRVWGIP
ncbi:hypothetical protein STTU_p0038 (plasmid) [Streptomyces sp. Tu6071]|nr:hypothetical protein STTU_p0038 [Streptomyces sp. Tu6071]